MLAAPITKDTYFERAHHFATTKLDGNPAFVIRPGTESWDVWRQYFERHLGWIPLVMRRMIIKRADPTAAIEAPDGMTVPTEFPQHFDSAFVERQGWMPTKMREESAPLPRRLHETMGELLARMPRNFGLGQKPDPVARPTKPQYQFPEDTSSVCKDWDYPRKQEVTNDDSQVQAAV